MIENNGLPVVSVIIPCRNEGKFIHQLLDNVLAQDYPRHLLEVIVVDGQSTDETPAIIQSFCKQHSFIRYLVNPDKTVPHALNKAIRESSGEYVVRMDVHAEYPREYISKLVDAVTKYNYDNIGGVCETVPSGDKCQAKAIAYASSHPFGVGNSYFRVGVKEPKEVDTVPFGCFRRDLFDKLGLFDEDLVRNQDDEFNARIINNGGRIVLLPDLIIRYYARDSLSKLSGMFYLYGFFKPLVNLKLGKPATLRQFAPPAFVLFALLFPLTVAFTSIAWYVYIFTLSVYMLMNLFFSVIIAAKHQNTMKCLWWLVISFLVIHFSYGWGYLNGTATFVIARKSIRNKNIAPNR